MEWKKFKKKGICLILHEHADLDALSSAIALQSFLTRIYNIKARICAKSLNSLAKFYAKEHDVNVTIVDEKLRCDVAVLIDVASLVQVGFELDANILVVFDHHANNDVPADYKFVKMYSSTGRVIYEYIGEVNAYESYHLLAALLYDTSFLRYADIEDLDVVRILLKISKSTLNDFWFIREHALTVEKEAKKFGKITIHFFKTVSFNQFAQLAVQVSTGLPLYSLSLRQLAVADQRTFVCAPCPALPAAPCKRRKYAP